MLKPLQPLTQNDSSITQAKEMTKPDIKNTSLLLNEIMKKERKTETKSQPVEKAYIESKVPSSLDNI
jgi:hypothetical protein